MSTIHEEMLIVTKEVASGMDEFDEHPIPADAIEVWLVYFEGSGPGTPNSKITINADPTGANTLIDSTEGDKITTVQQEITGTWDGVKTVRLTCSNGETETIPMTGKAMIRIKRP